MFFFLFVLAILFLINNTSTLNYSLEKKDSHLKISYHKNNSKLYIIK